MARCRSNNRDQCHRTGVGRNFKWQPPPLVSPSNKLPTMSLGRVAHERQKIQLTPAAKDISCGKKQFGVGTLSNYYSVSVRRLGKPPQWQWEIQRRPKPLGVKLCGPGSSQSPRPSWPAKKPYENCSMASPMSGSPVPAKPVVRAGVLVTNDRSFHFRPPLPLGHSFPRSGEKMARISETVFRTLKLFGSGSHLHLRCHC